MTSQYIYSPSQPGKVSRKYHSLPCRLIRNMTAAGVYLIFPEPIVRQLAPTLSRRAQLTPGQGIMAPATTTGTTAGGVLLLGQR